MMLEQREHKDYVYTLRHMLSVLMIRQSSWQLSEEEMKKTQEGIEALKVAIELMDNQILA